MLFLVLAIGLASVGAAFAAWTDTLTISGTVNTGVLEWEFTGLPIHGDLGLDPNCFFDLDGGEWVVMDKDVASTTVEIVAPDTLLVTIDNAYPYYGNHIAFWVHGLGTIPLRIWKVNFKVGDTVIYTQYAVPPTQYVYLDLDGDTEFDLELKWGDHFGTQLHFCDEMDISFDLLVLQPAPQNESLSFTIELVGIQWNEYPIP